MKTSQRLCLLAIATGHLFASSALAQPVENISWCSRSGKNTFQEFLLSRDHGRQKFQEWLHARPGMSGTWVRHGSALIIYASDATFSFQVASVSSKKLVLVRRDRSKEVYYIDHCDVEDDALRP